jgi:hypothetical protein
MTRSRIITVVVTVLALAFSFVTWAITFGNQGWRLSKAYPGAIIHVYYAHSPDPSPYDLVRRMLSPAPYIGPTECATLSLKNLPYPLRFEAVHGEHLGYIDVRNCTIEDISALLSPESKIPYVSFHGCDLSRVPDEQRAQLRAVWHDGEQRYIYSLGDV